MASPPPLPGSSSEGYQPPPSTTSTTSLPSSTTATATPGRITAPELLDLQVGYLWFTFVLHLHGFMQVVVPTNTI
jgi:hypothetical protein